MFDFENLLRRRLCSRFNCENPVGYSDLEIAEHLNFFPYDVGATYRTFLRVCGKENGGMFIYGHNWKLPCLLDRNDAMRQTAEEHEFRMPKRMFSFLDYIGDFYWCIEGDKGDDPAVVRFDLDQFVSMNDNLSTFLLQWEEMDE